jgi:hypothetical protein
LEEKEWTDVNTYFVDDDYMKNMELELLAGKFFSVESGESNHNFIVIKNRNVLRLMNNRWQLLFLRNYRKI